MYALVPSLRSARSRGAAIVVSLLCVALGLACADAGTGPARSPLAGLSQAAGQDSAGNPPPPNPSPGTNTPGYVLGTVLGPSAPGAGNDSLATAPRVPGARVAAFPVTGGSAGSPTLGPEAASSTTGADGRFVLPTVPGGAYVVTITPPAASIYGGVWVTVTIHENSHLFPWWVVLWKK
ncbi:MAG: carboxypeptidase-like regulatory domain-containing protein [Gemmatimonadota bacterium]|nr:carboxypeptidase-like regulatory domain-containing protein [Gemmatimonadota bacterium]